MREHLTFYRLWKDEKWSRPWSHVTFNPVSERIYMITTKTSYNICHLRSVYLLTLENTMSNPDETRIFYEKFLSLINSIKQRDALIIRGDFNAKTKLQVLGMEDELGVENYLNSKVNENADLHTEFCKLHNILITNTIF